MTDILEDMDKVEVNTVAIAAFVRLVIVVAVVVMVMIVEMLLVVELAVVTLVSAGGGNESLVRASGSGCGNGSLMLLVY